MFWVFPIVAIVLSILAVAFAIVSLYIDDWQRDFVTSTAATVDEPHAALAAHRSDLPPAELANHTIAVVGHLPRWRLVKLDEGHGEVTIRFVHATPLLRLKDDITVRISPDNGGSVLRAESKSRLLKGDFGQNPRNLRELLAALDDKQPALAR